MLPDGLTAQIYIEDLPSLPIFGLIQQAESISDRDMYNTFNMGLGMVLAVPAEQEAEALRLLSAAGENARTVGEVTRGYASVELSWFHD